MGPPCSSCCIRENPCLSKPPNAAASFSTQRMHGRTSCCAAEPTLDVTLEAALSGSAFWMVGCFGGGVSSMLCACRRCPILIVGPKIVKDNWRSELRTW